jgi:hypothetical protein
VIRAISRVTSSSTISGRWASSHSFSIGFSISRTTASSAPLSAGASLLWRKAERLASRLPAGGGRVLGKQARPFGDRIVELEHVLFRRRLGARDPARTRGRGRSRAPARVAAVLGDHALDGGKDLLHRRVLLNLAHIERLIAYCCGDVTGGSVTGLRELGGAVRVETGTMRGPSSQSDQLFE